MQSQKIHKDDQRQKLQIDNPLLERLKHSNTY